jgi:hypothetical protein
MAISKIISLKLYWEVFSFFQRMVNTMYKEQDILNKSPHSHNLITFCCSFLLVGVHSLLYLTYKLNYHV